MKKHSFLAGMLTMALIVGLGMSALAATGSFTITVDPVNIQVNGVTFAPKDAKGNDVPVFAYGGTTYAPLRALAEAYGLEVGYDSTANMATVKKPTTTTSTQPSTTHNDDRTTPDPPSQGNDTSNNDTDNSLTVDVPGVTVPPRPAPTDWYPGPGGEEQPKDPAPSGGGGGSYTPPATSSDNNGGAK